MIAAKQKTGLRPPSLSGQRPPSECPSDVAADLFNSHGSTPLYEIAHGLEVEAAKRLGAKGIYPNVDFTAVSSTRSSASKLISIRRFDRSRRGLVRSLVGAVKTIGFIGRPKSMWAPQTPHIFQLRRLKGVLRVDRFSFFERLPRNEPGATTFTSAYLTFVQLSRTDRVLDVRSGCGDRSVWIAIHGDVMSLSTVTYDISNSSSGRRQRRIRPAPTVCAQYNALPFEDETFALITAEWAAVEFGLGTSLKLWRRLVPIGGFIALSYLAS